MLTTFSVAGSQSLLEAIVESLRNLFEFPFYLQNVFAKNGNYVMWGGY